MKITKIPDIVFDMDEHMCADISSYMIGSMPIQNKDKVGIDFLMICFFVNCIMHDCLHACKYTFCTYLIRRLRP